jgi:stage V sporulation protein AD
MPRFLRAATPVSVLASAAVGGYEERRGPYGEAFDYCSTDDTFGAVSFELAEAEMARLALTLALGKLSLGDAQLDLLLSGDLQNQCLASSGGPASVGAPFLGLFGACSTMVEGLGIGMLALYLKVLLHQRGFNYLLLLSHIFSVGN